MRCGFVDDIDGFLQGEETGADVAGDGHFHQVLLHGIGGDFVVSDEDEVGTEPVGPGHADLAVDEAVIDAGEEDVGFCHRSFLYVGGWGGLPKS